jgi:hypothetical protein
MNGETRQLLACHRWLRLDGWVQNNFFCGEPAPDAPGIYCFLIPHYGVVYIGKSIRLSNRLRDSHEIQRLLNSKDYTPSRYFKEVSGNLDLAEKEAIADWQPILNRRGVSSSLPSVRLLDYESLEVMQ